MTDHAGNFTWVSPSAEAVFGYRPEDLLGTAGLLVIHPDDMPTVAAALKAVLRTPGSHTTIELRIRHQDGSWRWIEEVVTNLLDHPGVRGLVGNLRDVTERRQAHAAAEASAAMFRGHFTHAAVGQAVATPDGRMIEANAAYCRITGYTLEELREWTGSSLTHPDDQQRYRDAFKQLRSGEVQAFDIEKRYVRKDGSIVHVAVSTSCVRNPDNKPLWMSTR